MPSPFLPFFDPTLHNPPSRLLMTPCSSLSIAITLPMLSHHRPPHQTSSSRHHHRHPPPHCHLHTKTSHRHPNSTPKPIIIKPHLRITTAIPFSLPLVIASPSSRFRHP